MPIGAKMYEQAAKEQPAEDKAAAETKVKGRRR